MKRGQYHRLASEKGEYGDRKYRKSKLS